MTEELTRKKSVLVIHPILVPYRVDFFNVISNVVDMDLVFEIKNSEVGYFDEVTLSANLTNKPIFLKKIRLPMGKYFPLGLTNLVKNKDIVITTEFSLTTVYVVFFKKITGSKFKHVVWTDDNPELVKTDKLHRKLLRWLVSKFVSGWIFSSKETQLMYQISFKNYASSFVSPIIHDDINYRDKLLKSNCHIPDLIDQYNLGGKRVFLCVARLMEEKRIDLLLRAYQRVGFVLNDTALVIVGEGYKKDSLVQLASELGISQSVKFVGFYENVKLAAWYQLASVFSLTSFYEAFGVVVNEALLAGLPVVITANVGARELIIEGKNGSVVDFGDEQVVADKLIYWMERSQKNINEEIRSSLMPITFLNANRGLKDFFETL